MLNYLQKKDAFVLQLLNGAGDLLDLVKAVSEEHRPNIDSMTKEQLMLYVAKSGHCSALVKVNNGVFIMGFNWVLARIGWSRKPNCQI